MGSVVHDGKAVQEIEGVSGQLEGVTICIYPIPHNYVYIIV